MARAPIFVVVRVLRAHATQHRNAGAQHVHRVGRGRQEFQRLLYRGGRLRSGARLVLYAVSSMLLGSLPWISR